MNPQFYMSMDRVREEEFVNHVQVNCSISFLPAKLAQEKTTGQYRQLNQAKYLLVHDTDIHRFRYQESLDNLGNAVQVIVPFDDTLNSLPFIEYGREMLGDKIIARIWMSNNTVFKEAQEKLRRVLKEIKKWAASNSSTKEKVDGIWIYNI